MKAQVFALMIFAVLGSACTKNPVRLVGRLGYNESWGCSSPVGSQDTSRAVCNQFKRLFSPADGTAITDNTRHLDALRPIPATVEVKWYDTEGGGKRLCGTSSFRTDLNGMYSKEVTTCGTPGEAYRAEFSVYLSYTFTKSNGKWGTVRGIWQEKQAYPVFDDFTGEVIQRPQFSRTDTVDGTEVETAFAIPALSFAMEGVEPEGSGADDGITPTLNVGTRVFLQDSSEDQFNYMRQVLSAWGTMVELHDKLRTELGDGDNYYDNMYVTEPTSGWENSYTIWFDNTWAFGWRGGIALYRPDLERFMTDGGSGNISWLLSGTTVLSHEFGHSIHGAFAPSSMKFDYAFANLMQRPNGTVYDWGHGGGQYQEMGAAFSEGIADSMGQYFLNGCNGWVAGRVPVGGADPFSNNMWNPSTQCDGSDGCSIHHIRYHLRNQRGLTEGSNAYADRVFRLNLLQLGAAVSGHRSVTSNSESRIGQFGCDLLDSNTNTGHASTIAGKRYLYDYTFEVAEALDGVVRDATYGEYTTAPGPETLRISFAQLLETMGSFCTTCSTFPGGREWGSAYNSDRISVETAGQSPQRFLEELVSRGWATWSQASTVLKSNYMEEIR